jgi:hypothetical protein
MDFYPASGYSNRVVHQVKQRASTQKLDGSGAIITRACAFTLAAFCVLEVVLPRAGRAAAALLLHRDSAALRWLESAGAATQAFAARGVAWSACATIVCCAATALARGRVAPRIAAIVVVAAAAWIAVRSRRGVEAADVWWPAAAGFAATGAALLASGRLFAALLQAGLLAYAAWALLVGRAGSHPWIDQASEALVLAGIAGAGLAGWTGTTAARRTLAGTAAALVIGAWVFSPDAARSVIRHLVSAGNSGLPTSPTAALVAAAAAGLVIATGARGLLSALIAALVCARKPEPWLVTGALASSALLLSQLPGLSSSSSSPSSSSPGSNSKSGLSSDSSSIPASESESSSGFSSAAAR